MVPPQLTTAVPPKAADTSLPKSSRGPSSPTASANQARGIKILDALASICVSQPSREVIAVGTHVNFGQNTITLVIGGNHKDSLQQQVEGHVSLVWTTVKHLGELYKTGIGLMGNAGRDIWVICSRRRYFLRATG